MVAVRPPPALAAVAAMVLGALVVGCGTTAERDAGANDDAGPGAGSSFLEARSPCAPEVTEVLDASSSLHLLPGAPEPSYLSDPPTSGPHLSGPAPSGARRTPLDRPTQVQVLEQGGVVIQHRDLDPASVAALEALAGEKVLVAPNPALPAPVVATAWLAKRTCQGLDVDALQRFVADHRDPDPQHG